MLEGGNDRLVMHRNRLPPSKETERKGGRGEEEEEEEEKRGRLAISEEGGRDAGWREVMKTKI